MGTWLDPDPTDPQLALRRVAEKQRTDVFAALPSSDERVSDGGDAMARWVGTDLPGVDHPLVEAAQLVRDDMCVMGGARRAMAVDRRGGVFPVPLAAGGQDGTRRGDDPRPRAGLSQPVGRPHGEGVRLDRRTWTTMAGQRDSARRPGPVPNWWPHTPGADTFQGWTRICASSANAWSQCTTSSRSRSVPLWCPCLIWIPLGRKPSWPQPKCAAGDRRVPRMGGSALKCGSERERVWAVDASARADRESKVRFPSDRAASLGSPRSIPGATREQ